MTSNPRKRLDDNIKKYLSGEIRKEVEIKDFLITVVYIRSKMQESRIEVGISVMPENRTGSAMKAIKKSAKYLAEGLKNQYNFKNTPYLDWKIDRTCKEYFEIEDKLSK
jgi:ribosome-binding factor A